MKLFYSPVAKQFLTIVCCDFLVFSYSALSGWSTINSTELQTENNSFQIGAIDLQQLSLIIALANVTSFIGNFACFPVIQAFGPKRTIHLFSIPIIVSALLIIYAQNIYYLYASRLLIGLVSGGLPCVIPVLINDICFNNIRGSLVSLNDTSVNLGLIASFLLGNCLNSLNQVQIILIVPCTFAIVLFLLPESPEHLAKCGKNQQALEARTFYKGIVKEAEIKKQASAADKNDKVSNEQTENTQNDTEKDLPLTLSDFITRQAKRAYVYSFVPYILSFLAGTFVLLAFVAEIFTRTGSPLSAKGASLVISITTLTGNLIFTAIADRFSRKSLYVSSSVVTAIWYFAFGCYCVFWLHRPGLEFLPLLCFACVTFTSTLGMMPIPYIISMEIFPKKIRPICFPLVMSTMYIILYCYQSIFHVFLDNIGLSWFMFMCGVICLLNALFGYFFTPDTRGKSYEEILELLSK